MTRSVPASRLSARSLLIALIPLAAASSVAFAGPTSAPFQASFTTAETFNTGPLPPYIDPAELDHVRCPPPLAGIVGKTLATGNAPHLGKTTGTATDCITLGAAFTFSLGKLTVSAANGDQVNIEYSGILAPTGPTPVFAITGTYTIKGGTGRFQNASGSGRLSGTENIQTFQGELTLTGLISY